MIEHNRQGTIEELARDSEVRLQVVLQAVDMHTWEYDTESGRVAFAAEWAKRKGYTVEQLPRDLPSWLAHVHPDDREIVRQRVQDVVDGKSLLFESEHRVTTQRGEWIWVQGRGRVIDWDRDGKPKRIVGVSQDISERRRLAEELDKHRHQLEALVVERTATTEASERQFRALIEWVPAAIAVHRDGAFLYANPECVQMLGCANVSELIGRAVSDFIHPDFRSLALERARLAFETGQAVPLRRMTFLTLGGERLEVEAQAVSVNYDGRPATLSTAKNIGDQLNAEAALREAIQAAESASRAKSRFLAAASHDLRQPVQSIRFFTDALRRGERSPAHARIADQLALSVNSLSDLLETLLDISKLDAGLVIADGSPLDIEAIFQSIDREFSLAAMAKDLRFKLAFPARSVRVLSDATLLMRLLRNLIDNAIKYTTHGGVLIGLRIRRRHVVFQVWDSGVGIAKADLKPIFDEYYQVGNAERDPGYGLGLGLSIVRRLAGVLGTEVRCRSRAGRGSVFEFSLPRAADMPLDEEPGVTLAPPPAPPSERRWRRLAIVEDNALVAEALELALEAEADEIVSFRSAESALHDERCWSADAWITDLRLPGLNGLQLLEQIAKLGGRIPPAVILTGDTAPERISLIQGAPWPVLFKPVNLDVLLQALIAQQPENTTH